MCRSFFRLFVILGGFHSLLRLLNRVVSSKARPKNPRCGNPRSSPFRSTSLFEKKVHGFFATQLTNGARHLTTHHTHLSMLSSVLNTLGMLLQERQVSVYSRPFPVRRLLQVASCNQVLPHCLNLLIIFCGRPGNLVFMFARCL